MKETETDFKFINMMKYLKKNIEFYTDKIPHDSSKLIIDDYKRIFNNLPIINKIIMRENIKAFLPQSIANNSKIEKAITLQNSSFEQEELINLDNHMIFSEHTSGTHGVPFTVLKSAEERIVLGNIVWKKRNAIGSIKPKNMYDFTNTNTCITCQLTANDSKLQILEYLKESEYSWWYLNEHVLNELAKIVLDKSMSFKNLQVIENSGSYIFQNQISEYEKIFNCTIANNYACREVWNIAYTCKCGYLHVNDYIYLELIDDDGNIITEANVEGNVVITSLILKTMPFIRYNLGDRACWIDGFCDCGNPCRRIKLLPGRQKIKGTEMYGNLIFQNIITTLLIKYNLTKYNEINIVQTSINQFTVNFKGNQENRRYMEKAFLSIAHSVLKNKNYQFNFTYDETKKYKSLFTSY